MATLQYLTRTSSAREETPQRVVTTQKKRAKKSIDFRRVRTRRRPTGAASPLRDATSTPAVRAVARGAIARSRDDGVDVDVDVDDARGARATRDDGARGARPTRDDASARRSSIARENRRDAHAREKREDERATLVARSMARDDERAVGAVRWARARSRKGRWRLDEDGIAGDARGCWANARADEDERRNRGRAEGSSRRREMW